LPPKNWTLNIDLTKLTRLSLSSQYPLESVGNRNLEAALRPQAQLERMVHLSIGRTFSGSFSDSMLESCPNLVTCHIYLDGAAEVKHKVRFFLLFRARLFLVVLKGCRS
jgi:hypothetical protein